MPDAHVTGADVAREARTWLGTPFHHAAALRGVGADCAGVVLGVARSLGLVEAFTLPAYPRRPTDQGGRLSEALAAACRPFAGAPEAGLLIAWRLAAAGGALHLGLLTGRARVIHAFSPVGRVVETDLAAPFGRRHAQLWALPGVEYAGG